MAFEYKGLSRRLRVIRDVDHIGLTGHGPGRQYSGCRGTERVESNGSPDDPRPPFHKEVLSDGPSVPSRGAVRAFRAARKHAADPTAADLNVNKTVPCWHRMGLYGARWTRSQSHGGGHDGDVQSG